MTGKLRETAGKLKKQVRILYFALKDRDLPLLPRLIAGITLAYALSPLDLIPDFIPILGYLDDLIILPALIALTIRVIPRGIWERARRRSEEEEMPRGKSFTAALIIILIWAGLLALILRKILKK